MNAHTPVVEAAALPSYRPRAVWIAIAAFVVAQAIVVLLFGNGPFIDEGVYTTMGVRVLAGKSDPYGWLGGSPWVAPVLFGLGYQLGGLAGARLVAVLLYAGAFVLLAAFTRRLFGGRAALWATLLLAMNGIFFSFAHLAVYDAAAFVCFAGCLWAIGEHGADGRLRWALAAGAFAGVAVVARYAAATAIAPALLLAFVVGSRPRAGHVAAAVLIAAGLPALHFLALNGTLIPPVTNIWAKLSGLFSRSNLAFGVVYVMLVPLVLAAGGAALVGRRRPALALVLLGLALPWPILHVALSHHVSFHKDMMFCFAFLFPLAGVGAARLWATRRRTAIALLAPLALWGVAQLHWEDRSWADMRPAARYVLAGLPPGARFAAGAGWDFRMYAVLDHGVTSPWDVLDAWDVEHARGDACQSVFIVAERSGPHDNSDPLLAAAARCGFKPVAEFPSSFYYVAPPAAHRLPKNFVVFGRPAPASLATTTTN